VQCDRCEEWFHLLCVGLAEDEVSEEEEYECFNCKQGRGHQAVLVGPGAGDTDTHHQGIHLTPGHLQGQKSAVMSGGGGVYGGISEGQGYGQGHGHSQGQIVHSSGRSISGIGGAGYNFADLGALRDLSEIATEVMESQESSKESLLCNDDSDGQGHQNMGSYSQVKVATSDVGQMERFTFETDDSSQDDEMKSSYSIGGNSVDSQNEQVSIVTESESSNIA